MKGRFDMSPIWSNKDPDLKAVVWTWMGEALISRIEIFRLKAA